MESVGDPLLQEQKSISAEGYQYSFTTIQDRVVSVVGAYVRLVWELSNFRKSVPPIEIVKNAQLIFRTDEVKKDILWKEHCSSSLRELVDKQFEANCIRFLSCLPKRADSDQAKNLWESISTYKNFLNEFAHLNTEKALVELRKTPNRQNITLIDEQVFDKVCAEYIYLLYKLFNENCMKGE